MPSASAKLEKQASIEAQDPIKQVLSVIEKKVRNLEKRKGKLDTYKYEFSQGKELNEDQKNAIKKYDEVIQSLEFAKDLQKQFISISQESVKIQKKQAKREQAERQVQEVQRTRELLVVQDVLNNMGLEHVRNCFLTGVQGALSLTEENLNQLDDLYKLISISRDSEEASSLPVEEQLIAAADHLVALLDGKNKEVLGTTYKDLKDLIFKIHECGFLNSSYALQKEVTNGEEEITENDAKDYGDEPEEDYTVLDQAIHPHTIAPLPPIFQPIFEASEIAEKIRVKEDAKDYGDEPEEDYMELDQAVVASEIQVSSSTPVASGMETQSIPQQVSVVNQQPLPVPSQPQSQQIQPPPSQTTPTPTVPPTSTVETFFSNYRPINEGNFNFLQESQIDLESPHMDPAVVAAHPMAPPPMLNCASQHSAFQEDPNVPRGPSPRPLSPTQVQQTGPQPVQSQVPQPLLQQQLPIGQPDYTQRIQTQTFTNQNFVGIPSMAAGGAPNFPSQTIYTLSQIEPLQPLPHPVSIGQTASPTGSPPPQDLSLALGNQPGVAPQGVEPKKHFMNVNAVAFESSYKQTSQVMSSSQNLDPSASSLPSSNFGSQSQPSQVLPADIHGSDSTPGSYPHQSGQSNFQSCGRGSSSGNFNSVSRGVRGGGPGRGGRGGGGSANGFNSRGGSGGNNGNYNNGRGNFQSYRENAGNYYPNNFQRENYSSGGQANFNNAYKRGGGGLGNGGGNRGSNTMRGGVSRGNVMRGGSIRGGSRGGYTKSNQAQ